jgi:WD40 repeat protein
MTFRVSTWAIVLTLVMAAPAAAQRQPKRLNANGDPIPAGAKTLLGSNRYRDIYSQFLHMDDEGKTFWSVGSDGMYRVCEVATGKVLETRRLPQPLNAGLISPDGKLEINANGQQILVCDMKTGAARAITLPQTQFVYRCALSGDGKTLVCQEQDNTQGTMQVTLLDVAGGNRRVIVNPVDQPFFDFAIAPDGKRVYLLSGDSVSCRDSDGKEQWKFPAPNGRLRLSPDGKKVCVVPYGQEQVKLRDAASGAEVGPALPKVNSTGPAEFSPDGKYLAASGPSEVKVIELATGKLVHSFQGFARSLAFTPDSQRIVVSAGVMQAYEMASGKALYPESREWGHSAFVDRFVWAPDSKRLLTSASGDNSLFLWDVQTGKVVCRTTGPVAGILAFGLAGGGKEIVGVVPSSELWVWDSETGKTKSQTKLSDENPNLAWINPTFSVDGSAVASLMVDYNTNRYSVALYKVASKKRLSLRDVDFSQVQQMGFAPGVWFGAPETGPVPGSLISMMQDGRALDLESGKASPPLECPKGQMAHVVLQSADGTLALGSMITMQQLNFEGRKGDFGYGPGMGGPSQMVIWERATGRVVRSVAGLSTANPIYGYPVGPYGGGMFGVQGAARWTMALAPDGRSLITTNGQGVEIRDIVTDKVLSSIATGQVARISLSPDGRWLATSGMDCTIAIWDLDGMPTAPRRAAPSKVELDDLWHELTDDNATKGMGAVWRLVEAEDAAVKLLASRLEPAPQPANDEHAALIKDLESDSYKKREAAFKRLRELGEAVEPALVERLKDRPSLEVERRIRLLLEPLAMQGPARGDPLRVSRAVQVVEHIGTPGALKLLEEWSRGAAGARLTRAAGEALARRKLATAEK